MADLPITLGATSPIQLPAFGVSASSLAPKQLWELKKRNANDTLPALLRFTNSAAIAGFNPPTINASTFSVTKVYSGIQVANPIDVVNDFDWTVSPKSSRVEVPVVYMNEKRLLMNSNVSNIANSVFSVLDSGETIAGSVVQALGSQISNFINGQTTTFTGNAVGNGVLQQGPAFSNFQSFNGLNANSPLVQPNLSQQIQTAAKYPTTSNSFSFDTINSFLQNQGFNSFTNSVLTPYNYLYATEPTGFTYQIPYFGDNYNSLSNDFGGTSNNFLNEAVQELGILSETAFKLANFIKPGTYIEKAKQFSMGDQGRQINIKFPLLNTISQSSISLNWQLLFGLIYQNKPGRVTRAIIDMPVIYEITIPGMVYMPYAYINSLTVNFIGARRLMTIKVPVATSNGDNFTPITTIIPDAYEVEIGITGMNEETRNFLYASITPQGVTTNPTRNT